jgi:carboxyl-terminal processing protease
MRLIRHFVLTLVLVAMQAGCRAKGFTATERIETVDAIWAALEENHPYAESSAQLSGVKAQARRYVAQPISRRDFIVALEKMLSLFDDPHLVLTDVEQYWNRNESTPLAYACGFIAGGGYFWTQFDRAQATSVNPAKSLPDQQLYQLVAVEGVPISPLACELLLAPVGSKVRVSILDQAGDEHELDINVVQPFLASKEKTATSSQPSSGPAESPTFPTWFPFSSSVIQTERVENVAIIRVDSLYNNFEISKFDEALAACTDARALILDLRFNRGGTVGNALRVIGRFIRGSKPVAIHQIRSFSPQLFGHIPIWYNIYLRSIPSEKLFYPRPLVVLIDSGTASAAEVVAFALRDVRGAILIGCRTAGAGAAIGDVVLPGGLRLIYGSQPIRRLRGEAIQFVGVEPDIKLEVDRIRVSEMGAREFATYYAEGTYAAIKQAKRLAKKWEGD